MLEAIDGVFAGVGFGAFAAAPEDVGFGAEFGAEVHGGHGFLDGVGADAGVAGGERAIFEDRGRRRGWWWPWGHCRPLFLRAFLKSATIWFFFAGEASMGTRSLSWKLTP